MAKIIIHNDNIHSIIEVMDSLSIFNIDYNESINIIKEAEHNGKAIVKELPFKEAILNYQNLLSKLTIKYEIIY